MSIQKIVPIAFAFLAIAAHAAPVAITNESVGVLYENGRFALTAAGGRTFALEGVARGAGGAARTGRAEEPVLGGGQALEVATPDGTVRVRVFPGLPFALFDATLRNEGGAARVENRVSLLDIALDLGRPASELTTMGTGGLATPEKNPGSYAWLVVADPTSGRGVVAAWLTHDRACGVVFPKVTDGKVAIEARGDYGNLRIKPGANAQTETLAIGYFDDARLGLEAWAEAVAKKYEVKLPRQQSGYCTWYSDKHGGAGDEKSIVELAAFAAKNLKEYGFDYVQIDDKWQAGTSKNGPNRNFTEVKTNGPYAGGMKPPADAIKQLGLVPGIWFMPFAGTHGDPYFKDEWFVRRATNGVPYETAWGGTCLDMTHPGARAHLQEVVTKAAKEWGYTFFKMDGLWTGTGTKQIYVNSGYKEDGMGDAVFSDPDKSNIEIFRGGLKLVRETAGPDVFFLGCCAPQNMRSYAASFGLVDAMRIGPDNGGHWKGWVGVSPVFGTRNYFLNNRVWYNDPDPIYARASIPLGEVKTMCSWTAIAGQLNASSDWLPELSADRIDVLRRTMPPHGLKTARPVDYLENDPARVWLLTDDRSGIRRTIVALYNWGESNQSFDVPLAKLGLDAATDYVAFDFWADAFVPPFRGHLQSDVAPHGCRVLSIRPAAKSPQLVGTSRHVTQGIVDVIEEKWDEATGTLSGRSRVVANDPYELRVIVPVGASWTAKAVSAADAKAEVRQDGPRIRAKISSATTREISWRMEFEKARVGVPAPKQVTELKAEPGFEFVTLNWLESGADGYAISRNDGATFACAKPPFQDSTVRAGTKYTYAVRSLGWGDAKSDAASVEVRMPAEPVKPAPPPKPDVHLSALKPVISTCGWGSLHNDQSVEGKPLTVDGVKYGKGIGVHAPALTVYAIPGDSTRFVATVGLDDEKRDDERSSVVFEVWGDVKEMGEPPVLLARTPVLKSGRLRSWAINVELNTRFREVRLVVTDAGDGIASDHADWVDAGFVLLNK